MKARSTERKALRALAARETGLPPGQDRVFASHLDLAGQEARALRLPVIPAEYEIQNPDGSFAFMLDFSALDSGDGLI
jgi:hypothetical protein